MTASVRILNVGAGDTKLTFDKDNPADCIRAARIVKDMLRRGYALLVQVPSKKADDKPTYQRVMEFREDTYEYIIADFDPVTAADADQQEPPADARPAKGRKRSLSATDTGAVAVPHRAGG